MYSDCDICFFAGRDLVTSDNVGDNKNSLILILILILTLIYDLSVFIYF
jgi:hypothetical protein